MIKEPTVAEETGLFTSPQPSTMLTGCSASTWEPMSHSKESRARSSPALTLPAALGAAVLHGKWSQPWAQARALGFLASVSAKGSIKRVLILILGPASLSQLLSITLPSRAEEDEPQQ